MISLSKLIDLIEELFWVIDWLEKDWFEMIVVEFSSTYFISVLSPF